MGLLVLLTLNLRRAVKANARETNVFEREERLEVTDGAIMRGSRNEKQLQQARSLVIQQKLTEGLLD